MTMAQTMLTLNPMVAAVMAPGFFCVYYSWNLWYTSIAPPPKTIGNTFRPPLPAKKSWNSCALLKYPEDHTIDQLAARFYISKYHMMRLFRQETGYTITEYLTEKRLHNANELLRRGTPVTEVAINPDSAIMLRSSAYKKKYRDTPHNLSRLNYKENFTI